MLNSQATDRVLDASFPLQCASPFLPPFHKFFCPSRKAPFVHPKAHFVLSHPRMCLPLDSLSVRRGTFEIVSSSRRHCARAVAPPSR
jgi:hypothetical protein